MNLYSYNLNKVNIKIRQHKVSFNYFCLNLFLMKLNCHLVMEKIGQKMRVTIFTKLDK